MKVVEFSLEQGNKYFGRIDGERFFIGTRVPYKGWKGLMNIVGTAIQRYDRARFRARHQFWADFIHPTAMAEGGLFHTLNTYDRARFTFSFLQFAAHVPNGDFVLYLRALLALPGATEYFPDLALENNRVCRVMDDGVVALESDTSTALLLDYFNPSLKEVEDTEVIQAAKFIHWAQNDSAHRDVQIDVGVALFKDKMARYAIQYGLDGASDAVCAVVADIRHQGRAKSGAILSALQQANQLNALLKIGEVEYAERIRTLRREVNALLKDGTFGKRKYKVAQKDFA